MGRPLKIKKADQTGNPATGGIDIGFPNFGSLTNPVYNSTNTLSAADFLGVVGGSNTVDSATYPTVQVRVFITGFAEADGYIIRQKGSHKYLVGDITARTALVAGRAYRITAVGDTAWTSYGASGNPQIGDIFTATAALADTGTGSVNAVGQCVLTSDLSPTAGLMSISYAIGGDSTEVAVSKLTNKYLQNWTGFANEAGTSLSTYADGGDNVGQVDYSGETTYVANFFTDTGTVIKSGEANNGTIDLAQVQKYNS
jgi:hypothetical protein